MFEHPKPTANHSSRHLHLVAATLCLFLCVPSAQVVADSHLYIVAHKDDDLLFMNPEQVYSIDGSHEVMVVYVTANQTYYTDSYRLSREEGVKAAYAYLARAPNSWHEHIICLTYESQVFRVRAATLCGTSPPITLVFLDVPDGHGTGFGGSFGDNSLASLWLERRHSARISTVPYLVGFDNTHALTESYSKRQLIDVMAALMERFAPKIIRIQDFTAYFPHQADTFRWSFLFAHGVVSAGLRQILRNASL